VVQIANCANQGIILLIFVQKSLLVVGLRTPLDSLLQIFLSPSLLTAIFFIFGVLRHNIFGLSV